MKKFTLYKVDPEKTEYRLSNIIAAIAYVGVDYDDDHRFVLYTNHNGKLRAHEYMFMNARHKRQDFKKYLGLVGECDEQGNLIKSTKADEREEEASWP